MNVHRHCTIRRLGHLVIGAVLLGSLGSSRSIAQPPSLTYTDLTPNSSPTSQIITAKAHALNTQGEVVGEYQSTEIRTGISTRKMAFIYLPAANAAYYPSYSSAGFHFLNKTLFYNPTLHAYVGDMIAYGVNSSGKVVGVSDTASGRKHAFLYDLTTDAISDLGTFNNVSGDSVAYAINNANWVVGSAALLNSGKGATTKPIAFVWQGSGSLIAMTPTSDLSSYGYAINNAVNGQGSPIYGAAGHRNPGTPNSALADGFKWTQAGGCVNLDPPSPVPDPPTGAYGINNAGYVVGRYSDMSYDGPCYWFGGSRTNIGGLVTNGSGTALSINNYSQIVGTAFVTGGAYHAFLYLSGTMYDLNSSIVSGLGSSVAVEARGINDSGMIVGFATSGSDTHAFLIH